MNPPGPLRLSPVFLPKVWAAPELAEPWGSLLGAPAKTGEVWLASDRHHVTRVDGGEHAGLGLDEVLARWPEWILGPGRKAGFPLLAKLLNVGQWLSVQVHPDDEAAARLEGEPWGKCEAWHVLKAQDKAQIIMGLCQGVCRADLERAVGEGRLAEILARVPAVAGDTFHLCAGTVHATGPGLVIFELQQASDVTYRFYDWDRMGDDGRPRQLHLDKALAVASVSGPGRPVQAKTLALSPNRVELLVSDPHFSLIKCHLRAAHELGAGAPRLLFTLHGRGRLDGAGGGLDRMEVAAGQCWLVPAGLTGCRITPAEGGLMLLECVG